MSDGGHLASQRCCFSTWRAIFYGHSGNCVLNFNQFWFHGYTWVSALKFNAVFVISWLLVQSNLKPLYVCKKIINLEKVKFGLDSLLGLHSSYFSFAKTYRGYVLVVLHLYPLCTWLCLLSLDLKNLVYMKSWFPLLICSSFVFHLK